ncbi:hypothetical protein [Actinopolymorpha alba]|uniref:hypothetical protein n=1 Tax=Actinopolymorpha alba TaxID=533267 RepID=UPI00035C9689|nr:hypothetical protein [Actinopolymorpha alba]
MGKKSKKKRMGRFETLLVGAVGGLLVASVIRELRRPATDRSWHGTVAGVPYDYRPPTVDRLRATWWAPEDDRIVQRTAYGLGWDLNVGRVVRLASEAVSQTAASNGSSPDRG